MVLDERAVLIRIPRNYKAGMSDDALYEATRKWWVMSPDRHRPDFAFAVANGAVRAVYTIDDWERNSSGNRWAFRGRRDAELESRFVGTDVSEHFPRGAQNPIRYVNC